MQLLLMNLLSTLLLMPVMNPEKVSVPVRVTLLMKVVLSARSPQSDSSTTDPGIRNRVRVPCPDISSPADAIDGVIGEASALSNRTTVLMAGKEGMSRNVQFGPICFSLSRIAVGPVPKAREGSVHLLRVRCPDRCHHPLDAAPPLPSGFLQLSASEEATAMPVGKARE